jgi:hypothetical protein
MSIDRAIRASWYDLPVQHSEEYLAWLHGSHLPALARRAGRLWVAHYAAVEKKQRPATARESSLRKCSDPAVPTGRQYLLLAAAADANVFGEPDWRAQDAALPEPDRRKLALRQGEYINVMVEAARIEGPAAADYRDGMQPPPCIQFGNFNIDWRDEPDVLAWYAKWRMPAMRACPGVIRVRRLCSIAGWAKHGMFYEFQSLAARNEFFLGHEDRDPAIRAWSDRMVEKLTHAPASSTLALRTWPPVAIDAS